MDQRSEWAEAYRKHYKTKRWKTLRLKVFARDGYICQQTGRLCNGKYPSPHSPVADHIRPPKGDERLFWDMNNIQTVTKVYHDSTKQSIEAGAEDLGRFSDDVDDNGWPTDQRHPANRP